MVLLIAGVSSWGREKDFLLVFINDELCIREAAKKAQVFLGHFLKSVGGHLGSISGVLGTYGGLWGAPKPN